MRKKNNSSEGMLNMFEQRVLDDSIEDHRQKIDIPESNNTDSCGLEEENDLNFVARYMKFLKKVVYRMNFRPRYKRIMLGITYRYIQNKADSNKVISKMYHVTETMIEMEMCKFMKDLFARNILWLNKDLDKLGDIKGEARQWLYHTANELCEATKFPFPPEKIDILNPIGLDKVHDILSDLYILVEPRKGRIVLKHIHAIFLAMQEYIVPATMPQVISLMEQKFTQKDFSINPEIVKTLLESFPLIEKVGDDQYQLKFEYLKKDYCQIGRIIYESHHLISKEEIRKEFNRRLPNEMKDISKVSINVLKDRDGRFRAHGRLGWSFSAEGKNESVSLLQTLREYVKQHDDIIRNDQLMDYLMEQNQTAYTIETIKSYISSYYTRCKEDKNILCRKDAVYQHPEHNWMKVHNVRPKNRTPEYYLQIAQFIFGYVKEKKDRCKVSEIVNLCYTKFNDKIKQKNLIYKILKRYITEDFKIAVIDGEKYIIHISVQ
ncbi:MAG: hypothetical protein GX416_03000 [Bacteroidales bacterium]|nr:hypothetical protein [Bacteroidales bacterium]